MIDIIISSSADKGINISTIREQLDIDNLTDRVIYEEISKLEPKVQTMFEKTGGTDTAVREPFLKMSWKVLKIFFVRIFTTKLFKILKFYQ